MHPPPSMIVFTVLSGLGLGMMTVLGLGFGTGTGFGWAAGLIALVSTGLGGLASVGHLARPDRAWRAFSQWRSSWLSREACLMVLSVVAFAVYAGLWLLGGTRIAPLGWLAAALALATVYSTAMIYHQLRPVPRWSATPTPALFLALALCGGLLACHAVRLLGGAADAAWPSALMLLGSGGVALWWQVRAQEIRRDKDGTTMESATGLGRIGRVRLLEPPHTGSNYLLREMAFRVARKRASQLRKLGAILGFLLPLLLVLFGGWLSVATLLALLSHLAGTMALRWLFFAEAEHVQALYYGQR